MRVISQRFIARYHLRKAKNDTQGLAKQNWREGYFREGNCISQAREVGEHGNALVQPDLWRRHEKAN